MSDKKKENAICTGNESSIIEVTKEETKMSTIEIIGIISAILIGIVIPVLAVGILILLFIVILQNKNADILGEIGKIVYFATKPSRNTVNIRVNPPSIINGSSAIAQNECVSVISETIGDNVKRRGYSEPFNVSPFIRNLPINQHPSEEKLA